MRPRTALLLFAAAAVASAVVLLWERRLPGTDERREQEGRLVPYLAVEDVSRIEIERPSGRLVLERAGEDWRLREPVDDRADSWEVEALLRDLIEAHVRTRVPAGEIKGGDEATGLGGAAPQVTLVAGSRRFVLRVGTVAAPGRVRYVRVAGDDRLAVVDEAVARAVERPAESLRDRDLFHFSTLDMKSVRVEKNGRTLFELAKRDSGRWWLTSPVEDEADQSTASRIAGALAALRAERFVDDPGADSVLAAPEWVVTIDHGSSEGPEVLAIGGARSGGEARYAKVTGRPAPFELRAEDLIEDLASGAEKLRSRLALDFVPYEVRSVTLERDGRRVVVERNAGEYEPARKWVCREPDGFDLAPEKVDPWLDGLSGIAIVRFVDDAGRAGAAFEEPLARIALTLGDRDGRSLELIVGGETDGGLFARRPDRPQPFVIEEKARSLLDAERLHRGPDGETGD